MQMTTRIVLGTSLFAAASFFFLKANSALRAIIGQVNQRVPAGQEIGSVGGSPAAILAEYRRLYPGEERATRFWKFFWLGVLFLALSIWPILFG